MVLLDMVDKILKIEKTENNSSNDVELEMHILEEGVSIIRLDSEKNDKVYFKNLTENDSKILNENLNKEMVVILYPSEDEYKKQIDLPIAEKLHYNLKLDSWRITN